MIVTFMYPLLLKNDVLVRGKMQKQKMFILTLWPNVLNDIYENSFEFLYVRDVFPMSID